MMIALALALLSLTATAPPPDDPVGEVDRPPVVVVVGEQDEGTSSLEAVVLDGECPAFLEKTGGGPGTCAIARIADHPRRVSRRPVVLAGATSDRPRPQVRLRC